MNELNTLVIKTTTNKVWWDDNTENKPSFSLFNTFKNNMTRNNNIKVEQVAFDTIHIVHSSNEITYVSLQRGDTIWYEYFFYYNRILNVLPQGYVIEFKLDIYTTFTLPYLQYLWDNNINVKLNRHHNWSQETLIYEDDLINAVPIMYSSVERKVCPTRTYYYVQIGGGNYYEIPWWDSGTYEVKEASKPISPLVYYVFKTDDTSRPLIALPALCVEQKYDYKHPSPTTPIIVKITKGDNIDPIFTGKTLPDIPDSSLPYKGDCFVYGVWNNVRTLNELSNTPENVEKFVGIYIIPDLGDAVKSNDFGYIQMNIRHNNHTTKANFLCLNLKPEGYQLGRWYVGKVELANILSKRSWNTRPTKNQDKLHWLLWDKIDFKVYNTTFDLNRAHASWVSNSDNTLNIWANGSYFNFTGESFVGCKLDYGTIKDTVISFGPSLPIYTDNYQKYIAATMSSRDSGLNIARWSAGLSIAQGIGSGAMGAFNKASSLVDEIMTYNKPNYFGAQVNPNFTPKRWTGWETGETIGSGLGAAYNNSIGGVFGLLAKQASIKADLKDKRRTLSPELVGGDVQTAIDGATIFSNPSKIIIGHLIEYKTLSSNTIKNLNNVIYFYGRYEPKIANLSTFKINSDFNFYQFDADYLSNIFGPTIRQANDVPIQREYYQLVFNQLIGGLRLYETNPTT